MARTPIPTWSFAVAVVRRGDRFLLVQEARHGQTWYLPAGRVEPGETLEEGARRETLEEAGVPIEPVGLLRMQYTPIGDGHARLWVAFLAVAVDDTPPKSKADHHSLQAGWFTLDELARLPLRGPEVVELCQEVARGLPAAPLDRLRR